MQYKMLGDSKIKVSKLCLGSMTWGSQNTQKDANEQIDVSLDNGINFLDYWKLDQKRQPKDKDHFGN